MPAASDASGRLRRALSHDRDSVQRQAPTAVDVSPRNDHRPPASMLQAGADRWFDACVRARSVTDRLICGIARLGREAWPAHTIASRDIRRWLGRAHGP